MDFADYFPVWGKLTPIQQNRILGAVMTRTVKKGTVIHNGSMDCTGLLLVKSGQLRAFILSEEGREITIYRLFDRDMCLFSASCMLRSIQFDVTIEAEKDTELWVIPAEVYQGIMEESAPVANYTNELMAARGSCGICTSSSACTALAKSQLSVTSTGLASLSCSAWLSRSAATHAGLQVPSASTRISDGPAIISMPTLPNTFRLAVAT